MAENPYEPPTGAESRLFSLSPPFVLVMLIFAGMGLGCVAVLYRHPLLVEFQAFVIIGLAIVTYGLLAFWGGYRARS